MLIMWKQSYIVHQLHQGFNLCVFVLSRATYMANGGAVFPPLTQSIPSVLDAPPSESKLWLALCCQRD